MQRINQWNFLKMYVNEEHFESATNINPMLDNHLYSLSSVWTKKVSYHDGNECNAIDYSQVSWRCIWHIKKIRDACTERVKWDAHKFEGRVKVVLGFKYAKVMTSTTSMKSNSSKHSCTKYPVIGKRQLWTRTWIFISLSCVKTFFWIEFRHIFVRNLAALHQLTTFNVCMRVCYIIDILCHDKSRYNTATLVECINPLK